ncbi:MAG TPA: Na/Pi symporter, partial [Planctomycetota bacterium]|nr:Na/Pi symporter [Planctomycetota bacterium]
MFSLLSYVAGGLVLFLYGMRLTSDGLREAAGGRLKAALSVLTSRRTTGLLVGVTVTFLLSSSSAVSVMLVELTNAGLLSLVQAVVVILGATIGTALFLQV